MGQSWRTATVEREKWNSEGESAGVRRPLRPGVLADGQGRTPTGPEFG